jgi:hypothetical protein
VTNTGTTPAAISGASVTGIADFVPGPAGGTTTNSCLVVQSNGQLGSLILQPSSSCTLGLYFFAFHFGTRSTTMTIKDNTGGQFSFALTGEAVGGYYIAGSGGEYETFGSPPGPFLASNGMPLNQPIVGVTQTPSGNGCWTVASDGGVFSVGDATFQGSAGGIRLNKPVVGMAATPTGNGYWLVASDGGVFSYGDAKFQGSTGAIRLNKPVVGMATTPTGNGYWLVASDGGIFNFGDAGFSGSTGAIRLSQPIVGMAASPSGTGYWLVASDGGIFNFGDAGFFGSTGGIHLNRPIVGMAPSPDGQGYWLVGSDTGVFTFNVPFRGSAADRGIVDAIGITPTTSPLTPPLLVTPLTLGPKSSSASLFQAIKSGRIQLEKPSVR